MKSGLVIGLALAAACAFGAGKTVRATGLAAQAEQLAVKLFPEERLNRMLGFFGPVTKKYMPVFQRFSDEYATSTNKLKLIERYMPQADAALAEGKAMKVPARYEKEKAGYVNKVEALLTAVKFSIKLSKYGE